MVSKLVKGLNSRGPHLRVYVKTVSVILRNQSELIKDTSTDTLINADLAITCQSAFKHDVCRLAPISKVKHWRVTAMAMIL